MNTYSTRHNAKRAAVSKGFDLNTLMFVEKDGGWTWVVNPVAPAPTTTTTTTEDDTADLRPTFLQNAEKDEAELDIPAFLKTDRAAAMRSIEQVAEPVAAPEAKPVRSVVPKGATVFVELASRDTGCTYKEVEQAIGFRVRKWFAKAASALGKELRTSKDGRELRYFV